MGTPAPAPTTAPVRSPRVVTVLAGVAALAVLLGLVALVSPTVRSQLALTLTRQDVPYVETYFVDVAQARACRPGRARFAADVAVRSHLRDAEAVPYVLRLVPAGGGRAVVERGEVATRPGQEAVVRVAARKPGRAYTAQVLFPGRDQRLLVRCEGSS